MFINLVLHASCGVPDVVKEKKRHMRHCPGTWGTVRLACGSSFDKCRVSAYAPGFSERLFFLVPVRCCSWNLSSQTCWFLGKRGPRLFSTVEYVLVLSKGDPISVCSVAFLFVLFFLKFVCLISSFSRFAILCLLWNFETIRYLLLSSFSLSRPFALFDSLCLSMYSSHIS